MRNPYDAYDSLSDKTLPMPRYGGRSVSDFYDPRARTPDLAPPPENKPRLAGSQPFSDRITGLMKDQATTIGDLGRSAADLKGSWYDRGMAPIASPPGGQTNWASALEKPVAAIGTSLANAFISKLGGSGSGGSSLGQRAFSPGWQSSASNAWRTGFGI